jgi:hypothetical protein
VIQFLAGQWINYLVDPADPVRWFCISAICFARQDQQDYTDFSQFPDETEKEQSAYAKGT